MPSSIRTTHEPLLRPRPIPEEVSLVNWPLRDEPVGASLVLALAAGAGWLAVWGSGSVVMGTVIFGLLAATLWRTWLPVRFHLGSGGVVQFVLGSERRLAWLDIARYELLNDGVMFFSQAEASPLATLEGVYMRWGNQREKVLAVLEFYLPQ